MKFTFMDQAWEDYLYWQEHDRDMLKQINRLLEEIRRTPFRGTGKPEPLKSNLRGYWSRRISAEHRIIYRVETDSVVLIQLRFLYRQ